jgi:hypothetical protein
VICERAANCVVAPCDPTLTRLEALGQPDPLLAIELPKDPIEPDAVRTA